MRPMPGLKTRPTYVSLHDGLTGAARSDRAASSAHSWSAVRQRRTRRTKGGEALLNVTPISSSDVRPLPVPPPCIAEGEWYALWTHSHCEQLVHDQLVAKGFQPFLPTLDVWSRRRGVRRLIRVPMFPGYLFLRGEMNKAAYLHVSAVRGLVRVLGERWDCLAVVPNPEVEAIRRASAAGHHVLPHPYLKEGRRARI